MSFSFKLSNLLAWSYHNIVYFFNIYKIYSIGPCFISNIDDLCLLPFFLDHFSWLVSINLFKETAFCFIDFLYCFYGFNQFGCNCYVYCFFPSTCFGLNLFFFCSIFRWKLRSLVTFLFSDISIQNINFPLNVNLVYPTNFDMLFSDFDPVQNIF